MSSTKDKRRIFIVEDHPITRRGLVELINHESDLTVCGEADMAARAGAFCADCESGIKGGCWCDFAGHTRADWLNSG